jgi:hypothetical protein
MYVLLAKGITTIGKKLRRIFEKISSYQFFAGSISTTEPHVHVLYLKGNYFQSAFQREKGGWWSSPVITTQKTHLTGVGFELAFFSIITYSWPHN